MKELEQYRILVLPVLKKYLIKRAAFFGSFAKGTNTAKSDMDLLIEPTRGFTIFEYFELEREISAITNRKVDLVEYIAIKSSIREEVLSTAIQIL